MIINKFWNKKVIGIAGALYQFMPTIYLTIMDKISTITQTLNMHSVGKNVTIQCKSIIRNPNNITLGDNIHIGRNVHLSTELSTAKLTIGSNTEINQKCDFDYSGNLKIGNNCLISENTVIETHTHGLNPHNPPLPMALNIEDHVWIGQRVTILHNVNTIGENSIIGAGSIVTKDVPPNTIVAGNPAKIIRKLT